MEVEALFLALQFLTLGDSRGVRRVSRQWRKVELTTNNRPSVERCQCRRQHILVGPDRVDTDVTNIEPAITLTMYKPLPLQLWPPRIISLVVETTEFNLAALTALKALKKLDLTNTGVSQSAIAGLATITALEELYLWGCRGVTDVTALAALKALKKLVLTNTGVSQSAIAALATITALEELPVQGCSGVTDVTALTALKALKKLNLGYTGVSQSAIAKHVHCVCC